MKLLAKTWLAAVAMSLIGLAAKLIGAEFGVHLPWWVAISPLLLIAAGTALFGFAWWLGAVLDEFIDWTLRKERGDK